MVQIIRKVTTRIFQKEENQRRIGNLPIHIQKLCGLTTNINKKKNNLSHYFIGVVICLIFCSIGVVQQNRVAEKDTSLYYILLPIFAFILGFRIINSNMESTKDTSVETRADPIKIFMTRTCKIFQRSYFKIEKIYIEMKNISVLINQIVFFCLCERVLMLEQPLASFYTLMFFNVIAYCIGYIKELIEREDWSMCVSVSEGSNMRHLALSTTKIVLEWTKAVTFVITIVFVLLLAAWGKGLKNYSPTAPFLIITTAYYIITEKVFVELILKFLEYKKFDSFENMERLYLPVFLKTVQIGLSGILTVACWSIGNYRLSILSSITNVRLRYKELDVNHWIILKKELIQLAGFRYAGKKDLLLHDDVCAICLTRMKTARITPCKHFFHADCLLRSISTTSLSCPICKQHLRNPCNI